jgi:hypothetical protein
MLHTPSATDTAERMMQQMEEPRDAPNDADAPVGPPDEAWRVLQSGALVHRLRLHQHI